MTYKKISTNPLVREYTEDPLLTPAEVASAFRVDPKTVTRWAKTGKFPNHGMIRTLGGHRRYRQSYVNSLLRAEGLPTQHHVIPSPEELEAAEAAERGRRFIEGQPTGKVRGYGGRA